MKGCQVPELVLEPQVPRENHEFTQSRRLVTEENGSLQLHWAGDVEFFEQRRRFREGCEWAGVVCFLWWVSGKLSKSVSVWGHRLKKTVVLLLLETPAQIHVQRNRAGPLQENSDPLQVPRVNLGP